MPSSLCLKTGCIEGYLNERMQTRATKCLEQHEGVEDDVLVLLFGLKADPKVQQLASCVTFELQPNDELELEVYAPSVPCFQISILAHLFEDYSRGTTLHSQLCHRGVTSRDHDIDARCRNVRGARGRPSSCAAAA